MASSAEEGNEVGLQYGAGPQGRRSDHSDRTTSFREEQCQRGRKKKRLALGLISRLITHPVHPLWFTGLDRDGGQRGRRCPL